MKLKDLHEESIGSVSARWTPKRMSELEIVEWCKKHASKFLAKKSPIYRGTEDGLTGLLNTTKLRRQSAHSNDYYNWWIDNEESWEEFPKRSKSIISTTDVATANRFGEAYIIIPADEARIGICPREDMWGSFKTLKGIAAVNEFVEELPNVIPDDYADNWDELQSRLKRTTAEMLENSEEPFMKKIIKLMVDGGYTNLFDYMEDYLFDPFVNDFEAVSAYQFNQTGDHELWVSGEVIQIEMDQMLDDVIEFLQQYYTDEQLGLGER